MTPTRSVEESFWHSPTNVAYGPTVSEVEELYVIWDRPTFQVQATVVAEAGAPVVSAFLCESLDGSLPFEARRLPSDAVVIDAIRRVGLSGIAPLVRLLGEESELDARYAATTAPEGRFELDLALEEHARLIVRRPRASIARQIEEVRRMQGEGMKTSEIERELMRRFGVSKRTAYRRIESAKDAPQSRVPTREE